MGGSYGIATLAKRFKCSTGLIARKLASVDSKGSVKGKKPVLQN